MSPYLIGKKMEYVCFIFVYLKEYGTIHLYVCLKHCQLYIDRLSINLLIIKIRKYGIITNETTLNNNDQRTASTMRTRIPQS